MISFFLKMQKNF